MTVPLHTIKTIVGENGLVVLPSGINTAGATQLALVRQNFYILDANSVLPHVYNLPCTWDFVLFIASVLGQFLRFIPRPVRRKHFEINDNIFSFFVNSIVPSIDTCFPYQQLQLFSGRKHEIIIATQKLLRLRGGLSLCKDIGMIT